MEKRPQLSNPRCGLQIRGRCNLTRASQIVGLNQEMGEGTLFPMLIAKTHISLVTGVSCPLIRSLINQAVLLEFHKTH